MEKGNCSGLQKLTVTKDKTAIAVGSGTLEVLATPVLAALAEETCWRSVQDQLEEGQTTVGTFLELRHFAPTPVGMAVVCQSELIEIDRRKLVFEVEIKDEKDVIGRARHERFIVDANVFQKKADAKASETKEAPAL